MEEAVRSALVIVTCLIAAACSAAGPNPRPLERGFATSAGVVDPYEDGKRHLAASRYQVAIERFGQALANDRRSLDAMNGLGIAYSRVGRFEIAQTYFERALQVDPTSALTLNNYGWSLAEQGRLRDAKPFLELALRHAEDPDLPVVAANIESIGRPRPPALVAALDRDRRPETHGHRLIRVAANVYRLESIAGHAEGVGVAGSAQASAEHLRTAEPALDPILDPHFGNRLIEIPPEPVSDPEAAAVLAGEKQ
jgi:tetratricopeptide (TPR) repeat protein